MDRHPNSTRLGTCSPLGALEAIEVGVNVDDGKNPPLVNRAIEANFRTGENISVDVGAYVAPHYRNHANEFITRLLQAAAGKAVWGPELNR